MPKPHRTSQPTESGDSDNMVTMTECKQMLAQQEEVFQKLIAKTEENYKSFIESHMVVTNKRIGEFIAKTVQKLEEVKTSLEFTQSHVDELRSKTNVDDVASSMKQIEEQVDFLENQSRC